MTREESITEDEREAVALLACGLDGGRLDLALFTRVGRRGTTPACRRHCHPAGLPT
jgi:hypothetical protein